LQSGIMKIHALQTGSVRIKVSQRVGRGWGLMRQLRILADRHWTEWLPIYAWAIETPHGVIVVDTGETARAMEPGYFPRWHPYYRLAVRMQVSANDEIGPALERVGIRAADVRTVILTHLHTDHAGGLHHFPNSEILVSPQEMRLAKGFAGQVRGYLPNRWPKWFAPREIPLEPAGFANFSRSCHITPDGSVVVVSTPGHTPGHVSVIALDGGISYFLAGDTTYAQHLLVEQCVDGVSPSVAAARQTLAAILEYARQNRTVYLPAHDPESARRLETKAVVQFGTHT
jgi:glyoxylase-like metal-dependent hydrolase (beta-lactamase superfamily II)